MTTKKQELTDNTRIYTNDAEDFLCVSYSEYIKLFVCKFNGKPFTFKTWNGCINKINYFVNKYQLTLID